MEIIIILRQKGFCKGKLKGLHMMEKLYSFMFKKLLNATQDWIESKEGRQYLNDVSDAIIDRQIIRLQGSAGGMMKSQPDNQTLFGALINAVLPRILPNILNTQPNNNLTQQKGALFYGEK